MLHLPRSRQLATRVAAFAVAGAAALAGWAGAASAHTESQYVAVPAGDQITVNFAPTHGCSGSPTTAVSVRVPAAGATAGEAAGFTATSEPDGDHTILRWTGGVLPADQDGEFPITFTVPDTVGELLLFPTVQTCEVGENAWIDGNPEGEFPAVRILVLPAGSEPAHDIDEVPADAPGRDLLTAVVDVDNPAATTVPTPDTSAAAPTTATPDTTAAPATTAAPEASTPSPSPSPSTGPAEATTAPPSTDASSSTVAPIEKDDGSNAAPMIVAAVIAVPLVAGSGIVLRRRRR